MSVRSRFAPPTAQSAWAAWLLAAGVTTLLFLSIGLPPGRSSGVAIWREAQPRERPRSEQLVFEAMPTPPVSAPTPVPTQPATRPATPRATVPPVRAPAASAPSGVQAPTRARNVAPDSANAARTAEPLRTSIPASLIPPRANAPALTTPPPSRADAAPTCSAPCLAALRAGVDVPERRLTPAERDSILHALMSSIPAAAQAAGGGSESTNGSGGTSIPAPRPGGLPPLTLPGGTSIPVGLPGGGPSRAQRKRDSTVNAHVLPILERLRKRADSVQAARRRDSLEAIAKQRRDSIAARARGRSDSTSTTRMRRPE